MPDSSALLPTHSSARLSSSASSAGSAPLRSLSFQPRCAQAREIAEFRGDGTGQLVVVELEEAKLGQVAKPSRQRAFQTVVAQPDARDAARGVGDDSVPVGHGLVAQPVVVVCPVRTAGGIV